MDLASDLRRSAARQGAAPALRFADEEVTYAELNARVDRVAATLRTLGLRPGDRVALLLGNTPVFVEAVYGAWRAGLVAVPLNTSSTGEDVRRILADCRAEVLLVDAERASVAADVTGARVLEAPGVWEQAVEGPDDSWDEAREGVAVLAYTAGTTGRPKGAVLTHANLRANHEQLSGSRLQVAPGDLVLGVLPLFHIYGLNVAMAYTLARGATLLLFERFDPARTSEAIRSRGVSVILGVPPMYRAWLDTASTADLSSVRIASSGAAPLEPRLAEAFADRFGVGIWEGYGLTETSPVLTTTAMSDAPRPGSVGRPLPGVSIRLRDDRGQPVATGDPGEVQARGPNVFTGYWGDAEATRAAFTEDGWFRTGDIAYARDGELCLVSRRDDLIIVSGFNVYPREVEEVLMRHPAVAAVAVVGVPNEASGEAVKAVVVPREGADLTVEEVDRFCRDSLARFKRPQEIELADGLPLLPTGKVLRRELRG